MSYRFDRKGLAHGESSEVRGADRPHGRRVRGVVRRAAPPGRAARRTSWWSCSTTPASPSSAATGPTSTPRTSTPSPPAGCSSRTSTSRRCARRRGRRCSPAARSTPSGMRSLVELPHRLPEPARPHLEPRRHRGRGAAATQGYATFCVGKWHLAPMEQCSAAGPVRPVAARPGLRPLLRVPRGRDRPVPPRAGLRQPPDRPAGRRPRTATTCQRGPGRPGCCGWSSDSKGVRPDRPFFAYLAVRRHPRAAPGAARRTSPSTAGAFDEGWDVVRERWFARQLELGVIPRGHRAGAAQPGRRAVGRRCPRTSSGWRARLQEAFAAFLDHTDDQIGRLVDGLRALGRARQHDLSCCCRQRRLARRAGRSACMHEMKFFNGILETPDEAIERHRRHRRPAQPHQLPVGLGAVRQHARSSGTSRTPTRAASTCR